MEPDTLKANLDTDAEMERLQVSLEEAEQTKLDGRSKNGILVKEMREKAVSEETRQKLQQNPYLEIWEIDYYSSSDEEDNDSDREKENSEEETESESEEEKKEEQTEPAEQAAT